MQINDLVFHPCSLDILEFKITGIHSYETHTIYSAKATHNVGACGRIEISLAEDNHGTLRFIGLDSESEYSSGLQDFTEGLYYNNKQKARLAYYKLAEMNSSINLDQKERIYKEAKANHEKIVNIIKIIRDNLKEQKE